MEVSGEKTREYLVVTEGVLTVECHGRSCQIRKDQVFKFETDQDHVYRNEGQEKACCTCFPGLSRKTVIRRVEWKNKQNDNNIQK
ncbi:MAG: cupin domain-containing protein [Coprococcus sp.]